MRNQRGITLIALSLTIIIMIVIGGITFNALAGENGILTATKNSKALEKEKEIKENLEFAWKARMFKIDEFFEIETISNYELTQLYDDLNMELKKTGKIVGIQVLPNSMPPVYQIMIEATNGGIYEIKINNDGEVTELEYNEDQSQNQYLAKLEDYSVNEKNIERVIKIEGPYTQGDANLFTYTILNSSLRTAEISGFANSDTTFAVIPETVTLNASVVIPEGITSTSTYVFFVCQNLKNVVLPTSLTVINEDMFNSCSVLESIDIPNTITKIGRNAFKNCDSLTSITIPASVTSFGEDAFADCDSLVNIVVDDNNLKYDSRENCNAIIETSTNKLVIGCKNSTIPSSVKTIGKDAFYYCETLTNIDIPESVTRIEDYAFHGCDNLESIILPSGLKYLGESVFEYCEELTEVIVPSGITSIKKYTFGGCKKLESVTIPESVTNIGIYAFEYSNKLTTVYYGGSEAQWNAIEIADYNTPLNSATIIYGK